MKPYIMPGNYSPTVYKLSKFTLACFSPQSKALPRLNTMHAIYIRGWWIMLEILYLMLKLTAYYSFIQIAYCSFRIAYCSLIPNQ